MGAQRAVAGPPHQKVRCGGDGGRRFMVSGENEKRLTKGVENGFSHFPKCMYVILNMYGY